MHDKYTILKENKKNVIVMIKVGNFYHLYDEDALIMFYLFKYVIGENNNRVGFPVKNLSKVVNNLKSKEISYYVDDNNFCYFDNENYYQILEKSKIYYDLVKDVDNIYKYLIDNIERKYIKRIITRIKEVIDEG